MKRRTFGTLLAAAATSLGFGRTVPAAHHRENPIHRIGLGQDSANALQIRIKENSVAGEPVKIAVFRDDPMTGKLYAGRLVFEEYPVATRLDETGTPFYVDHRELESFARAVLALEKSS
jgi:hypothetical protein